MNSEGTNYPMMSLTANTYWLYNNHYYKMLAGQEDWYPMSTKPFTQLLPKYSSPAQLTLFDPAPYTNRLTWGTKDPNGPKET